MLTEKDLHTINAALIRGDDVRIQNTPNGGYRILSDTVKVLTDSKKQRSGKVWAPNFDGQGNGTWIRKNESSLTSERPAPPKPPDTVELSTLAKSILAGERILPDTT